MSIIDKLLEFSDDQDVTAAAASTNVVDAQVARDLGVGEPLFLVVEVCEVFVDGGSDSTLAVKLQTDGDEAFGSAVDLFTLGTFAALSPVGTRFVYPLPPTAAYERYLRLYYTPANGNLTSSGINAYITNTVGVQKNYGSGFSIS